MLGRRPFAAVLTLALIAPVTVLTTSTTASAAPTPSAKKVAAKHLPHPARNAKNATEHDPHTVLVKFKKSAGQATRDTAVQSRGGRGAQALAGTDFVKVTTTGRADELASRLSADPSVAEVTLDYVREASATPNDYFYATTREQEYLKTVRMPTAWDRSKGSLSQVVAVLDTGVNGKHPDLTGRTVAGFNAITDVGIAAGAASDDRGHGSMVAGIIAAETNNAEGIAGVAWNAKVMPVKVLNSQGKGTDSDIVQGIKWAADHGARIINMSLGGPDDSPALHDAVKYAVGKGAVVIVAAGNSGGDRPEYPAAYAEAIAVAATDDAGKLTYFSTHGSWVDVAAPGWGILSTERNSDYYFGDGTSFSAPIVAGIAVLLRSKTPSMTPAQIAARLRTTARDAGPRGIDPYYGAGIVDATNALGGGWAADVAQPSNGVNEPNDVPSRALGRESAGLTYGSLSTEGDVDWWRFDVPSQRQVTFTLTPPWFDSNAAQNVDPVLAVYDENLKLVAEVDQTAEGEAETATVRLTGGPHYVTVRNFNGARDDRDYSLSIEPGGAGILNPATQVVPGAAYGPLAYGDVTGDSKGDVVAGVVPGSSTGQLHVLRQQSTGGLLAPVAYETSGASVVRNVVTTQLDGDTNRDVVVSTDLGIQLFRQTDTHVLATPQVVPDTTGTTFVAAGDLDGDGRTDLVQSTDTEIAVLLAQTDGSWVRTVVDAAGARKLVIGDLDGDGRPDVAGSRGDTVVVLHNTTAGWTPTSQTVPGDSGTNAIAVADANGDGRTDLVAATGGNRPSSRLLVWHQAADHTLAATPTSMVVPDIPEALEAADVTGDGRTDFVMAHGGWSTVSVVEQRADGTLLAASGSFANSPSSYDLTGLAVGDLTGDGRIDAVAPSYNGLDLLSNAGAPTPTGAQRLVRSTWPADFGSGLPVTTTPTVTFARDVNASTVTTSTVRVVNGRTGSVVPATVAYDAAKRTATIRPTAALYDYAPYRLLVSGVKDSSGATMAEVSSSTFRTVDLAPAAVGSFKATGALRAATLTWKAPAVNDLDRYIVRMSTGSTPPANVTAGTGVYSGTATSATVTLAQGTTYSFKIWAKDRSGKYSPSAWGKLVGTAETIGSSTTSLTKGRSVTLTSKLTRRDTGGAIAGVPVQLYWRKVGSTTWNLTVTRTSSSTGTVSYAHAPSASVDYMWVYRGSSAFVGSSSALRRVTVR
ncbi:S8 family serine peptidase [Terrabacter sp. LjRoot27]|uniref:S8 family serine peptidase n=1 Tax=Terrabacter sp. LjRoot27 TaxID=3342306 RepID=UPI003ED15521